MVQPDDGDRVQDGAAEPYGSRAVLDAGTLETIRESNQGFLTLLVRRHAAEPTLAVFGLNVASAAAVAALNEHGRRAVAACPYTLFNLRFDDAGFWRRVAVDCRDPGPDSLADEAAFARTTLFLAWHLTRYNDPAAAIALGMTPAVQRVWRRLPLPALACATSAALPQLAARWGAQPLFWARLLQVTAAAGSPGRHADARLLGLQLLAAEGLGLAPAARGSGSGRF